MLKRGYPIILAASLLFVSCSIHTPASVIKKKVFPKWQRHQKLVSMLTNYQVRGSFTYFSKSKKVYARFNLQQINANHYHLILINPLGVKAMDLYVDPSIAQLVNYQGKRYVAKNPEIMIYKLFNIYIPFNNLCKWILGLPGSSDNFSVDNRGYLHQINYNYKGEYWNVAYKKYISSNNGILPAMPSSIELHQNGNHIKLKIDHWNFFNKKYDVSTPLAFPSKA